MVTGTTKLAVFAALAMSLAACSGGATPAAPETAPPAPASAEPSAVAGGNCDVATADGNTTNTGMQTIATTIFDSLECGTDESLPDQLRAAAADPEMRAQAKAAGASLEVDSAGGGTVLKMVAGRSGCTVTVLDAMDAKTMTCLDLPG